MVAPLRGPRPVSTTRTARLPTTIAMLGQPIIAQTWSETLTVSSPSTGLFWAERMAVANAARGSSFVYIAVLLYHAFGNAGWASPPCAPPRLESYSMIGRELSPGSHSTLVRVVD